MTNDLKFSGVAPVVINYNGSPDEVYAPVRSSSCDINIVSDKILDDLYTARKDEVCVKIEKRIPRKEREIIFSDDGSVSTHNGSYNINNTYRIERKVQFYTNNDNEFLFIGIIRGIDNAQKRVVIKMSDNYIWSLVDPAETGYDYCYTTSTNTYPYTYFFDKYNDQEYRCYVIASIYFIQKRLSDNTWSTAQGLYYYDGTTHNANFGGEYVIHRGLSTEVFFGKQRYTWDNSYTRWNKEQDVTDIDGGSYFATYSSWYHQIKDENGVVQHCLVVNGYNSSDVELSNWIVKLTPDASTFKKMIKLKSGWDDLDRLFTDSENNVYYVETSGDIYFWSWTAKDWVRWITFTGDFVADTFYIDYYIPRNHTVVLRYENNGYYEYIYLKVLTPPTLTVEEHIVPGEYDYQVVWEGYKMPNTYSQDVTQNLDSIAITAIDPVSIMKYVTIDKLMTKPALVTYKELIGAALAYVKLDADRLFVEQSVSYGGSYFGDNGMLDLKCQIANFWDESDKPGNLYEMIEELLRPFCMTLAFSGNSYWIYNQNKTEGNRLFTKYKLDISGNMTYESEDVLTPLVYEMDSEWKSNNTQSAAIQINETYEKVSGTASTMVPNYSKMAIDLVDYTQRDKYDAGWMNIQRNKVKGFTKRNNTVTTDTADHWFYIWNGVYTNSEYNLEPWSAPVSWYLNINKMYEYLESSYTQYGSDTGSVLNFYGGQNNPSGTGKEQEIEKSVSISKRITAYAADNGFPPELLEFSDLDWTGHVSGGELTLQKQNTSNSKFGSGIVMGDSDRIIYHQMYENIYLNSINNPTINLDITRSFSRTGIDIPFDALNYNTAENVTYTLGGNLSSCDTNYLPQPWNSSQVVVNSIYFRRYSAGSSIRVTPVWDRRRIDMYVVLSDNSVIQFNGKEWVTDTQVKEENAFYLLKLMNNEHLFHTDHRYDVIETSDGQHYSLTDEPFTYYTDNNGGVYPDEHGTAHTCSVYKSGLNYWESNVNGTSAGQMSIILPQVEDPAAVVYVDVYNSSMLGMTGCDDIGGSFTGQPFYYALGGGEFTGPVYVNFLPKNLSHVKAEHLDLDITITVPESNLGQMFSESDIRYELNSNSNYVEEFEMPSFQVNTYNQLVASSFSYLIFDSYLADPGEFIINGQAARPECFTIQAYMNWLNRIRKIYSKTIKPIDKELEMNNIMKYISSPEVGNNNLLVLSDAWDLKSNRHSIVAIEDHNWDVDYVQTQDAVELPRKARNERWNYPTAIK